MSNSSRIEQATRQHVGAVLTSKMITELVKVAFPDYTGGVYPSDAAWKRNAEGVLECRGKQPYGDAVLEHLADSSFKVLGDAEIVRMPRKRVAKPAPVAAVETPVTPAVAQEAVPAQKKSKSKKKAKAKKQAA